MKKIKDYRMFKIYDTRYQDDCYLSSLVDFLKNGGYELYGHPIGSGDGIYQVIVKYGDEETESRHKNICYEYDNKIRSFLEFIEKKIHTEIKKPINRKEYDVHRKWKNDLIEIMSMFIETFKNKD